MIAGNAIAKLTTNFLILKETAIFFQSTKKLNAVPSYVDIVPNQLKCYRYLRIRSSGYHAASPIRFDYC